LPEPVLPMELTETMYPKTLEEQRWRW